MSIRRTWYSVLGTRYSVLGWWLLTAAAVAAPPKLNNLYPAGGQRGQSVAVTLAGDFSSWPVEVWMDRPGITVTAEKDKGKLKFDLAADAIPGIYWMRLTNADGASVLKPFIIGTLPDVTEGEPNDAPEKPQALEPRTVVNGKLAKSGDVDGYRLELKQGQSLVASLQANSILGSPMDAMLQVCELIERPYAIPMATEEQSSSETNRPQRPVEAYVVSQNHDAHGVDPQIVFTAPRDGGYLVRVFAFPATPDSTIRFAGGEDYIYRLTLTTGPFIDHSLPLAVPREESQVSLGGYNLPAGSATIVPPLSAESSLLTPPDAPLAWVWRSDCAGAFAAPRLEYAALIEPSEVPVPAAISGRLASPGEIDSFAFQAKKDQKLRLRIEAKALGFPTDAVLAILDSAGKTLSEADDTGRDDRDPQLEFTPPADSRYTITVRDLARRGDTRMVYRLTVEPVQPDFALSLAADSFVLEKDKPLEVTVNIAVRDGLREPIELQAIGLPAGITCQPMKFEPSGDSPMADASGGRRGRKSGQSQQPSGPSVKLVFKGDAGSMKSGGGAFRIEGRTAGNQPLVRTARFPLNLPLAGSHYAAWLTVKK